MKGSAGGSVPLGACADAVGDVSVALVCGGFDDL